MSERIHFCRYLQRAFVCLFMGLYWVPGQPQKKIAVVQPEKKWVNWKRFTEYSKLYFSFVLTSTHKYIEAMSIYQFIILHMILYNIFKD